MRIPAIPGFDPEAFQKYFKNTGWLMFGKVLSLIVGIFIAKFLGPHDFGDLSVATAFAAIIAAVGTLGLDSFVIREVLDEPAKRDEILGTAFWMRLAVSLVLVPASVLIYIFSRSIAEQQGTDLTLIITFCASALLFKSFNIIDSYFQSQVRSKFVVQVQNVCLILSSIIKITFVLLKLPLVYFAFALVIDGLMLAIGLVIIYHRDKLHIRNWTFKTHRAKSLLSKSWPLILSAVMVTLYMQIDILMLKHFAGSTEAGIYSSAARISESWYFIPVAIVTSVFPAIIHARKTDPPRYQKRLQNLYDLLIIISVPVALVVSVGADTFIHLVYGDQFQGAGIMLSIHIWSGIFVFLGSASGQYLLAEGYTMISFYRTAVGAIINILLNLWLIPLYGGLGASIATLIAYFSATFFILVFARTRHQGLKMLKSLFLISLIQKIPRR
ncbi:flippase [Daejeonella lutea]|uniref:Membrane protein involved in the export of O-antigen and teichoic acid n=1 Tax=Daejeonella lutea TaxID=572036 RepID=A0A1T5D5K8_9SPHI|nr:flippase [Daejeonella lutea]SKB66916.1 Membrane protein involved in the export of O-antigen and teichoic acid [Daejeonella lutea]